MSRARARVAIVRASPETVLDDYRRLLGLVDLERALPRGPEVALEIDLTWHHFFPACNTPPWQLEGVIRALLARGYPRERIFGCHDARALVSAGRGERANRHRQVLAKYGVRSVHLDAAGEPRPGQDRIVYRPRGPLMVLEDLFHDGLRLPPRLMGASVVHLPTLKTHSFTALSGAMQQAMGALLGERRHFAQGVLHETLVDLLMVQREIHPGMLSVMDGTFAGDGPGPRCLMPYVKDYLLASDDPVALDATAARLMGFEPLSVRFLRLAHERGVGVGDPREIEVVGEDLERVDFHFRRELDTLASRGQRLLNDWPLRPLEKLLLRTPLVRLAHLASWLYHDAFWFPLVGRGRVSDMMTTKWGRLFDTYHHGGVASPQVPLAAAAILPVAPAPRIPAA